MEWSKIEKELQTLRKVSKIKPSDAAWQNICDGLDKKAADDKRRLYLTWGTLAASLLLGGSFTYFVATEPVVNHPVYQHEVLTPDDGIQVVTSPAIEKQSTTALQPVSSVKLKRTVSKVFIENSAKVVLGTVAETQDNTKQLLDMAPDLQIDNLEVREEQQLVSEKVLTVSVDSNLLLKQVESELEQEFRETKVRKIYEATKKVIVDISNSKYEK